MLTDFQVFRLITSPVQAAEIKRWIVKELMSERDLFQILNSVHTMAHTFMNH